MDQNELLDLFFSQKKENTIFKQLRNDPASFDSSAMIDFINLLCDIPFECFIDYIAQHKNENMIDSSVLTQSSNIENCKTKICLAFRSVNDKGLTLTEIGGLLHDDGKERSNNTLNRFGRDQTKTAMQLGLTRSYSDGKWYLSPIGKVFPELTDSVKDKILARCLLRDPLYFQLVVDALAKDIQITDYMIDLDSDITINRRRSSIYNLVKIIYAEVSRECPTKLHLILNK